MKEGSMKMIWICMALNVMLLGANIGFAYPLLVLGHLQWFILSMCLMSCQSLLIMLLGWMIGRHLA